MSSVQRSVQDVVLPNNTGMAFEVITGSILEVRAKSIVDFVCFDLHNVMERFDQARTKANQDKLFITKGDFLFSKANREMFLIIEDTYPEGTHDLQYGMCSRSRWEWDLRRGVTPEKRFGPSAGISQYPDHGCEENLSWALAAYGIAPEDIPSPWNIFHTMEIDGKSGLMRMTAIRPREVATVGVRALIDGLVGISACPDPRTPGQEVRVIVREP